MQTTFIFNVYTYTDEFSYIVATKKIVKLKRVNLNTCLDYMHKKYPRHLGFVFELNNLINHIK